MHALARIFEKDAVKAHEFLGAFLAKYLELASLEQTYFQKQFVSSEDLSQKFDVFRRENEYEMIGKRVRPWIVGLSEIDELVKCIDVFNQFTSQGQLSKNSQYSASSAFKLSLDGGDAEQNIMTQADEEGALTLAIRSIEPFSSKKLLQDMQERLLLMSHYRL